MNISDGFESIRRGKQLDNSKSTSAVILIINPQEANLRQILTILIPMLMVDAIIIKMIIALCKPLATAALLHNKYGVVMCQ